MTRFFDAIRNFGYRRGPDRLVGGLCGGLAAQANVSVVLVRVLMVIAFLLPGVGLIAYLIAWILTPWQSGSIPLERFLDRLSGRDSV
ncbi:PspC domain-containing protein [Ruania alkalisoli]|uniref:PspC domain-containing protein n=1 Tax=Ruania alkalisoli TaxID=2779775 RepID=A0A7M1SX53_9MICO|nr:PspC domain-containing protein [Ruania alkalisoli]QOR72166.1 PspC domain-containing protein [Ruania alkalisoli]